VARRIVVDGFAELARRPFAEGVNAFCWRRTLAGDFLGVARALAPDVGSEGVMNVDVDTLMDLRSQFPDAIDAMLQDVRALAELGRDPVLNCITRYPRDERDVPIQTHVMSFHADRAPIEVDTWLCTYCGKPSEGLDNDEARRLIDDPTIRAAIVQSGVEDESFELHYGALDGAQPFSFGAGNLWRIAVQWPGCPVPPCLHRAPEFVSGDEPRLLLIC
jgi:hypothetical protein